MAFPYLHYDVFTSTPLLGNQLAVFTDARGLDRGRMQAIAREMNFAESTFILPAETSGTDTRMRIFTPFVEMPIAGHPTIGTTFALAHIGVIPFGAAQFTFGVNIGPVPVDLEWEGDRLKFAWMTQPNPAFGAPIVGAEHLAVLDAVGLTEGDLAVGLPIQLVSCGVPYLMVPAVDAAIVDRAAPKEAAFEGLAGAYGKEMGIFVFAAAPERGAAAVHSRMFAPGLGIIEDPATGSASGPLGCYMVQHGVATATTQQRIVSDQGVKMGRASRIHVSIEGTADAITKVRVGGEAVLVARGELLV
jgi:trans-2,3-dihydro-3-hydroxyanthranilate isomerase